MSKNFDMNLAEFSSKVRNFAQKVVPEKVVVFQKKIVLEALRRVVLKTPVDTGRARGNWQVTIGKQAEGVIDNSKWDKKRKVSKVNEAGLPQNLNTTDRDVINAGLAAITDLPPFSVVYVTNNLEYIEYLEEGSSSQAPEGMVALTIEELKAMFR